MDSGMTSRGTRSPLARLAGASLLLGLLLCTGCECSPGSVVGTVSPSEMVRGEPTTLTVSLDAPLWDEPFTIEAQGIMRMNLSIQRDAHITRAFFSNTMGGPKGTRRSPTSGFSTRPPSPSTCCSPQDWPAGSYDPWVSRGAPNLCQQTDSNLMAVEVR